MTESLFLKLYPEYRSNADPYPVIIRDEMHEALFGYKREKPVSLSDLDAMMAWPPTKWGGAVSGIVNRNIMNTKSLEEINKIVEGMQEAMPIGRKPDTSFYWRGNKSEIRLKLIKFFHEYGDSYTAEEIIDATKRYVDSFNGDYRYMRLLKYFIHKQEVRDGERVPVSELATFLENRDEGAGAHRIIGLDWSDKPL